MPQDLLASYEQTTFTHDRKTRTVFRKGEGPAVIVMPEMPGITPQVIGFADRLVELGCTAVVPHLFGEPGKPNDKMPAAALYGVSSLVPACVSKEFTVFATGKSSPIVDWLRALAADEHGRCGGPGVGAVGMCFTGGFALAMAVDERMLAPVLSQPSLPFGFGKKSKHNIDISPRDLTRVKQRVEDEDLKVLGMRFCGDPLVPGDRFQFLREQLGDGFVGIELDDSAANPDFRMRPHSVLTNHLIDEPGEPTRDALNQVLDLFRTKLLQGN